MRVVSRVFLYDDNEKFFGPGPYQLLCLVEEKGSLRAAAKEMNLSYSKALKMVSKAQEVLGFTLIEKKIGGIGGGGSVLTSQTKEFLKKYKAFEEECYESNRRLYSQYFSDKS